MRTLRTIGVVGSAVALLLASGIAFANERQATTTRGGNMSDNDYRIISASTTARMQTLRTKAEERLNDIEDKAKQDIAKMLVTQFDNLNKTWTDRFMQTLDHYDTLLVKVQARATIAANAGKDVSATTAAIAAAKTAILNARTAVAAQAAKTYTLNPATISSTATSTPSGQDKLMKALRTSFQTMHKTLFADLFALRDGAMRDARKALQNAIQTLGQIPNVDNDNATSTEKSNQ